MLLFCFIIISSIVVILYTSDGGRGGAGGGGVYICMRVYTGVDGLKMWVIAKLSMSLGTVFVLECVQECAE